MTYQQTAIRRGGTTPKMTGCRRNPTAQFAGAGPIHGAARRCSSLAYSSSEYATLLAPCATCVSAQRGRGD